MTALGRKKAPHVLTQDALTIKIKASRSSRFVTGGGAVCLEAGGTALKIL